MSKRLFVLYVLVNLILIQSCSSGDCSSSTRSDYWYDYLSDELDDEPKMGQVLSWLEQAGFEFETESFEDEVYIQVFLESNKESSWLCRVGDVVGALSFDESGTLSGISIVAWKKSLWPW